MDEPSSSAAKEHGDEMLRCLVSLTGAVEVEAVKRAQIETYRVRCPSTVVKLEDDVLEYKKLRGRLVDKLRTLRDHGPETTVVDDLVKAAIDLATDDDAIMCHDLVSTLRQEVDQMALLRRRSEPPKPKKKKQPTKKTKPQPPYEPSPEDLQNLSLDASSASLH